MRRIAFFEDSRALQFGPLTCLRPVFELVCGHFSLRDRVIRRLSIVEWGAFLRPHLAEVYREEHPEAHVNDDLWLQRESTLLINGRWLPDLERLRQLQPDEVAISGETVVAITVDADEAHAIAGADWHEVLPRLATSRRRIDAGGHLLEWPWDLVHWNADVLTSDFRSRRKRAGKVDFGPQVAIQGRDEDLFVDPTAQIEPFVVLDARGGPIWIEGGARVLPFTRLEGPCYVGRDTQLFRAHVREGCTLGPNCRIGGEIEESIFHGFSNKYHDGFLGHSYVCPWVNFGALSTNSDLKNDYSHVKVPLWGEPIDSGSSKVGSFFGDHVKTALSSLFNTGSTIGVMSVILPGGELMPKHIPAYARIWHGALEEFPHAVDSVLRAARTAMGRRNVDLTPAMERLLRRVYELTSPERSMAITRSHEKRQARWDAMTHTV